MTAGISFYNPVDNSFEGMCGGGLRNCGVWGDEQRLYLVIPKERKTEMSCIGTLFMGYVALQTY